MVFSMTRDLDILDFGRGSMLPLWLNPRRNVLLKGSREMLQVVLALDVEVLGSLKLGVREKC